MFEVGKLSDESLDSFLAELEKVKFQGSAISDLNEHFLVY